MRWHRYLAKWFWRQESINKAIIGYMLPKSGGVRILDMSHDLCMSPAILYPATSWMEKDGLMHSWFKDGPYPRTRLYQLTFAGRTRLADKEAKEATDEFRKKV